MESVAEFHRGSNHYVGDGSMDDKELVALRLRLLEEELGELKEAVLSEDRNDAHVLKELADVQYVLSGFAVVFGLPLPEAFERVHQSNLTKFTDGVLLKRNDGKLLKGPNYKPPNLDDLV